MIELQFPTTELGQVLWAQMSLLSITLLYVFRIGPMGSEEFNSLSDIEHKRFSTTTKRKAGTALVIALLLPGFSTQELPSRIALALAVALSVLLIPRLRLSAYRKGPLLKLDSMIDLLSISGSVLVFGLLLGYTGIEIKEPLITIPVSGKTFLKGLVILNGAAFLIGGATLTIRAVLDRVSVKPKLNAEPERGTGQTLGRGAQQSTARDVDLKEYNRGRIIGNLERLLLLVLAMLQAYEAIALVIAAKGIVRWPEMENRDFAEYFLIGSLLSLLLAILIAILVQLLTASM